MAKIYRHGDIVLRKVDKLPEGEITKHEIGFTQHGETGKLHVLPKVKFDEVEWERKFVTTPADGDVMTHPEHPPLELPGNTIFEVTRVRAIKPYVD